MITVAFTPSQESFRALPAKDSPKVSRYHAAGKTLLSVKSQPRFLLLLHPVQSPARPLLGLDCTPSPLALSLPVPQSKLSVIV